MSWGLAAGRRVAPFSALLLACCAQVPAPPQVQSPAPKQPPSAAPAQAARARPSPAPELPLDQRERERAQTLMQEGRYADAAQHWEILQMLHPEQADYAEKLAEARSRATQAAAQHVQEAQQARRQGQTDRAAALYLRALSADPRNADAAQGLREIQKESDRRAYARGNSETSQRGASRSAPSAVERRDLDSGIMLLHQGDDAAAVQALESYVRRYPRDDLGRRTLQDAYAQQARRLAQDGKKEQALAEMEKAIELRDKSTPELTRSVQSLRKEIAEDYYQQGLRVQATELNQAISLFEKCLKYDPDHVQAARQLDRARRMEQNLRSMPEAGTTP